MEINPQNEQFYRTLSDAIPQIVWSAPADGEIDYWNKPWFVYTGLTAEHSRNEGWLAALHPDDLPGFLEAWNVALNRSANDPAAGTFEGVYRLKRGVDGTYRWHRIQATLTHADGGQSGRWFGTWTDVNFQKRLEDAAREALTTMQAILEDSSAGSSATPRILPEQLEPILKLLEKPLKPEDSPSPQPVCASKDRKLRILLAEDNPVNQKLVARVLEKKGHAVSLATNGVEAVAAVQEAPFDVVLMDVQMPQMDGLEATAAIRNREAETGAHVPIIAMTANALEGDRELCLEAGMDGYVRKPIQTDELWKEIDQCVPAPPADAEASTATAPRPQVLDRAALMDTVEGDLEFLAEILQIFLDTYPNQMSVIREAIRRSDSHALQRAAHTVKGSVGNLRALAAFDAAMKLEMMAKKGDMAHAAEACAALEGEIERFKQALVDLGKSPDAAEEKHSPG